MDLGLWMSCCARVLIGGEGTGDVAIVWCVGSGVVTCWAIEEVVGDVVGEVGGGIVWSLDVSGELIMCVVLKIFNRAIKLGCNERVKFSENIKNFRLVFDGKSPKKVSKIVKK